MVYRRVTLLTFVVMLLLMFIHADSDYSVVIDSNLKKTIYEEHIETTIDVVFKDISLYNSAVKLSYHIFDAEMNLIKFENDRWPLLVTDGLASVNISIDLTTVENLEVYEKIVIAFDLVDEKNLYWFASNEKISFQSEEITYDRNNMNRILSLYQTIFIQQKIQITISVVFLLLLIITYRKYRISEIVSGSNS